ncbi:hypothetical protein GGX14DRAFT_626548 [Mycena pura]|uniref:Novel STAND NTPase 1 domain-containing protein n=1 Tax=Mycena pura TaxID=153505 RepID=A0AAD6VLC7_9AGAR|nr:hypothetical protein GGX14DRAFT_626548 [Mycena pura]
MPSASRLEKLVQYTTVTATTVREIAGNANVPFLEAAAMGTTAILNTVQAYRDRSNEEQVATMLEQIHEILCAMIHLYVDCQTDGALPPAQLYDIAKFTETLQNIYGLMKSQQGIAKIKQLFKQFDPARQLKVCQEELQGSLARFRLQTNGITVNKVSEMQKDAQRQHEELLTLLADHPGLTNSDQSSSVAGTLSTFTNSSGSLSLLPAYPSIFHGRDCELSEVVTSLKSDSARIAILGAGGMGKTSLSIAVLHDSNVAKKFTNRYFVPCQSNATRTDLVLSIASHVGVAKDSNLLRKVILHLMDGPPVLMILDNFETPWEPMSSRAAVEEVLSLLTDIPHLALVITMRGAERPSQVKWTRPFVQPLEPLEHAAALQTFHDIAGTDHEESLVCELLSLSGNLPLAVDLIANVVVYEGCATTLDRWQTEYTRVVSDGYDKKSSLDISITLSFSSTRMTREAQALLSLLSILPNGLSDAELVHMGPTSRLSALMPIREHVRGFYPPQQVLKTALRQYYQKVIDLWRAPMIPPSAVKILSASLANMQTILEDGLRSDLEAMDMTKTLQSTISLNMFSRVHLVATMPLMSLVEDIIIRFPTERVYGEFFVEMFSGTYFHRIRDPELKFVLANHHFDNNPDIEQKARWFNALGLYYLHSQNNHETALQYHEKALAMAETLPHPTTVLWAAFSAISRLLYNKGNFADGRAHAQKAQQIVTILGDELGQAEVFRQEAICCMGLGFFDEAAHLCRRVRDFTCMWGLQGSNADIHNQFLEAEIYLLKTEYPVACSIYTQIVRGTPPGYFRANALLNIAIIDIVMGAPSAVVHSNLDAARAPRLTFMETSHIDSVDAVLTLREEGPVAARAKLETLFRKLKMCDSQSATFCLERLADLDHHMYDCQTTLTWVAVYLGSALRSKDKLSTVKAVKCLGQIAAAEGETATAMSLFQVALDGFTFMDVHQWRADCMMRMSKIHLACGEVLQAKELFGAALPLFDRCMVRPPAYADDIALKLAGIHVQKQGLAETPLFELQNGRLTGPVSRAEIAADVA